VFDNVERNKENINIKLKKEIKIKHKIDFLLKK